MASYPGTNKTFAARSNGQVIDAAHVGDLQDEVAAIEDGVLNGTARLNSSNSTVVNLSVSGGSTFAGPVVFSSGVTFGANGTITIPRLPCCRLTHSAVTAIASSATWVGLNWDTEVYDSTGLHSTTTNSSRITLTSSGLWVIGASLSVLGSAFVDGEIRLRFNDDVSLGGNISHAEGSLPYAVSATGQLLVTSTTDYVTVQMQSQKSNGNLSSHSTTYAMTFWAHRVSN